MCLQFLHGPSDRQAAEAVRCRIDFKYALGLELDDPGFHHSVLSDFRDRLAQGDRADALLDLMLERLRMAGLVKERGRHRTDSTHVLATARKLTRLELVTEAVRAALEELARHAPEMLDGLVTAEWGERYGRPVRMCSQPSHPVARLTQTGLDARDLLGRFRENRPGQVLGPMLEVLRQIMVQHFVVDARGQLRPRTERDGLAPARIRIESPYETGARWVRRGNTRWTGYLTHVTETCDETSISVITDVATVASAAVTRLPECVPGTVTIGRFTIVTTPSTRAFADTPSRGMKPFVHGCRGKESGVAMAYLLGREDATIGMVKERGGCGDRA